MKKKIPKILILSALLIPIITTAQVHFVTSGFNSAGGSITENQSFDYSFGEVVSYSIESDNVKGNIGILQVIPDEMVGISNEHFSQISIAPNPSMGVFEIHNEVAANYTFKIYHTDGTLQAEGEHSGNRHSIDISEFTPGVYILNLSIGKNSQNFKLIKI